MRLRGPLALFAVCAAAQSGALEAQTVCELAWDLEPSLRIGSVDGEVTLNRVRQLTVGEDGLVYLAQGGENYVAVFDQQGSRLANIGGPGQGPAEFGAAPDQLSWRGDTLVVNEIFATHYFDPGGEEVRRISFRVRFPYEASTFTTGVPLIDGTFLGGRLLNPPTRLFWTMESVPLRRFAADGTVIDTVAVIAPLVPAVGDSEFQREHENHLLGHPLAWHSLHTRLPYVVTRRGDAVITAALHRTDPGVFQLLKLGVDGDTILNRPIKVDPIRVSRTEAAAIREGYANWFAGAPQGTELLRNRVREALEIPDYYPPVRSIVAGADNTIWILREARPRPQDVWEVFGPSGELEGRVTITEGAYGSEPWGPRIRLLHTSREDVWGVTTDEWDVPYLTRFQVRRRC